MKFKMREESGSAIVEATISLSAFMFTIVTLLAIVNICIVQARINTAINATAKELSHYSYLYSLTGIPGSKAELNDAAKEHEGQIDGVLDDVNTVFTEIQNLSFGKSKSDDEKPGSAENIQGMLEQIESSYKNIEESSGSLRNTLEEMAEDPKSVALGLAKIGVSDAWDVATSRLIAAPLSKGLCKKNLVSQKGEDVDSYLKRLGVVPAGNGSYLDGLDFSQSTIFPGSSNEIRVVVSYDVKVIALLPIDFSFHFVQTAVTHGWLAGEDSYRTASKVLLEETNRSVWIDGTVEERVKLIRNQGIMDYEDQGYEQLTGASYSDVHMYSKEKNQFLAIHSMNPLYSEPGERTMTLEDINEDVVRNSVELLCTGITDTTKNMKTVQTKRTESDGSVKKTKNECENSTRKIVIVIPQDKGLLEKMEQIVATCDKKGVEVVLVDSYGMGARTTTVDSEQTGGEE